MKISKKLQVKRQVFHQYQWFFGANQMPPYYFDLLQVILHLKLLKTEKNYFFDPGAHHFLITFAGE